jgi:hypothetical protein
MNQMKTTVFEVWRRGTRRLAARAGGAIALLTAVVQTSYLVKRAPDDLTAIVLWAAVIVLIASWAVIGLLGRARGYVVVVLIVAMALSQLVANLTHVSNLEGFPSLAAVLYPVAVTAAAAVFFDVGFFVVLAVAVAVYISSVDLLEMSAWSVLINPTTAAIAFWVVASTIWTVATRADLAHEAAIVERNAQAALEAQVEADAQIQRVLHDTVIAGLMVASMADRGYDDQTVRQTALEGVRGLQEVDDGFATPAD